MENILVIADGAAIGSEIDKIMKLTGVRKNIALYLPESFEWMILKTGLLNDKELKEILVEPEQYIESEKYFSWERFFTDLLVQTSKGTYLQYSKKTLPLAYLKGTVVKRILNVIKNVDFEWKK